MKMLKMIRELQCCQRDKNVYMIHSMMRLVRKKKSVKQYMRK